MTNGDRIRAMNDDALSLWLAHFGVDYAKQVIDENQKPPIKIVVKCTTEDVFAIAKSILTLLKEDMQEDV